MNILGAITGLFSTSKAGDVAVDIVRKITKTDGMSDLEKSEFVLKYMEVTKNQSISRRVIAISITAIYVLLCLSWLGATWLDIEDVAKETKEFLTETINQPFNIIVGFYFVVNIVKGFKDK